MVGHGPDGCGPGEESVLVVVATVVVEVPDERELTGIPLTDQILTENVCDIDLLRARLEFIQVRVGVLLAHVERGEVVLPTVVVVIDEDPDAEVRVVEDKAPKIANERLHADAQRNEIVIVREIAEMNFGKSFLERPE